MKVCSKAPAGVTLIANTFIDQYMPHANGEFVKVYLYLLRCADSGQELSLSSIADVFEHTEKDIRRALTYWQNQRLLRAETDAEGTIVSVTLNELPGQAPERTQPQGEESDVIAPAQAGSMDSGAFAPAQAGSMDSGAFAPARAGSVDSGRSSFLSPEDQQEMRQLFFVAEQYLQRPLTSSEQSDFIYYHDTLHFSGDLIEYLIEYCISKGSANRHYMRRVALAWAEAGVSTVREAKQETTLYNRNYFTVLNAFGIRGRAPATDEQEFMARWFDGFGLPLDVVLEACRRTIRQTHQPNFQYADKILEQWHQNQVASLADIERLDALHKKDQAKKEPKKPAVRPQRSSGNRFNNFPQREYDYDQLEKQLLSQ